CRVCDELSRIKSANTGERGATIAVAYSRKATTMKIKPSFAVGVVGILAIVGLLGWTASAQAPAPATATLACDRDPAPDTNQPNPRGVPRGRAGGRPPRIDPSLRSRGWPCGENASPRGLFGDDAWPTLQGVFFFFSCLPFLPLNPPADG